MSTINVLEYQHGPTEAGPWGEPEALHITMGSLRDWSAPVQVYIDDVAEWRRARVVSYARVQGDE